MMLLRKYMSLLGVGSAKIDLILEKNTFIPGESIKGYFHIKGGTIQQQLRRIECDLILTDQDDNHLQTIETTTIFTTKTIEAEQLNKIPFNFTLPQTLASSSKSVLYRFKTKMHFDEGVKSEDLDFIKIVSE